MLTGSNQQIVSLFEAGLSIDKIAQETGYDEASIKATLMQFCQTYRDTIRSKDTDDATKATLDFTIEEQANAKRVISLLATHAEDEHLQARCARYIRDDAKGRLDIHKMVQGLNVNVTMFNLQFQKAEAAIKRSKALSAKPDDIDVVAEVKQETVTV